MRVRIIRLSLCCVIGLALSAVVAVLAAIGAPRAPRTSTSTPDYLFSLHSEAEDTWLREQAAWASTLGPERAPDDSGLGYSRWTQYADWGRPTYTKRMEIPGIQAPLTQAEMSIPIEQRPLVLHRVTYQPLGLSRIDHAGWPFRCFGSTLQATYDPTTGWIPVEQGGGMLSRTVASVVGLFNAPTIVGDAALYDGVASRRIIPLGVRWVPLAGNTLFYAMIVLGVMNVPRSYDLIVHRRRRNRGECPKCGYSLAGIESAICPECGKPTERKA